MALRGRGPTKSAASVGRSDVWSSGLCSPDTSFASIRLHAMPAEVRNPASACKSRRLQADGHHLVHRCRIAHNRSPILIACPDFLTPSAWKLQVVCRSYVRFGWKLVALHYKGLGFRNARRGLAEALPRPTDSKCVYSRNSISGREKETRRASVYSIIPLKVAQYGCENCQNAQKISCL
jgi:hypothetical protein